MRKGYKQVPGTRYQGVIPCRVDTGASVGDENEMGSSHCEADEQWGQASGSLMKMEYDI